MDGKEKIIELLGDYRLLTVAQLSRLLDASQQMTRRWLRQLKGAKMVLEVSRKASSRGRVAPALCLSDAAVKPHIVEHHLALNTVRVSLVMLEGYACAFLSHMGGELRLSIPTTPHGETDGHTFIPDAVFALGRDGKKLLFFLEVDMGTEPLRTQREGATDFLGKLDAYRVYFATKRYKEFEERLPGPFRGFRLLVVANTSARLSGLSRFVDTEPFCGFVWLTGLEALESEGWGGGIWHAGGKSVALQSVLR